MPDFAADLDAPARPKCMTVRVLDFIDGEPVFFEDIHDHSVRPEDESWLKWWHAVGMGIQANWKRMRDDLLILKWMKEGRVVELTAAPFSEDVGRPCWIQPRLRQGWMERDYVHGGDNGEALAGVKVTNRLPRTETHDVAIHVPENPDEQPVIYRYPKQP